MGWVISATGVMGVWLLSWQRALKETKENRNERKKLSNKNEQVRVAAIISVAEDGHDDFLPVIARLATQHELAGQEAAAYALGVFKDESSYATLLNLSKSQNAMVKLSALRSLYQLGREEVKEQIERMAKSQDLFAIYLLGSIPGSENTLYGLLENDNPQVKANAAVALLELGDRRSLRVIAELLVNDSRDLGIIKTSSNGKSLTAIRIIPSARQNFESVHIGLEVSLHLREALLTKAVELPEADFLALANLIFESQQNDLIPVLVDVLVNHPTEATIALLSKHQQKAGAPLVRNYCNLALYKLDVEGPFAENLCKWVTNEHNVDLISFRPLVPREFWDKEQFQLTPQETSRLLVEAFETFVSMQDDKGIDVLITAIQNGNPKNKYALIGLLMRAIQ